MERRLLSRAVRLRLSWLQFLVVEVVFFFGGVVAVDPGGYGDTQERSY